MFTLRPTRPAYLCGLTALASLACGDAGTATSEPDASTSTTGTSTTPKVPTTGTDGDEPTPTSSSSTSTGNTGDDPDISSSNAGSTGALSDCDNGVVEAPEECDDGLANDDSAFCKENCTLNVCGDGKLFIGWELCDQGPGNADEYGSLCNSQCEPGIRCGDHKLQPGFETCDLGPDNGGNKGDDQGILCDASCKALQLRGFVTAATFTGDLGGLFGADLKCRDAAAAAGLAEPERFHALLSTGDIDAKDRFKAVAAALPYVLVTGKKFADNFAALITNGPLSEGIAATETGAALYQGYVATNTTPGGVSFSPDQHCQSWTSPSGVHDARVGVNSVSMNAPDWQDWKNTQAWIGTTKQDCDKKNLHLYCLEI